MQSTFAQAMLRWHDFYLMVGTASASLTGLLFVAVSLHIGTISRPSAGEARVLAGQTLTSFLYVLVISLLFLVPNQNPPGLSLPLLAMGVLGCISMARSYVQLHRARREGKGFLGTGHLLRRFALPTVSYLGLAVVSVVALSGHPQPLAWLLFVVLLLLLNATHSAWDLMMLFAEWGPGGRDG